MTNNPLTALTAGADEKAIRIGDIKINLTNDLTVKRIYENHPTYDFIYWNIIGEILAENGVSDAQLVDVGANIGDTIAHFRRFSAGRAIGVEAQEHFHALMQKNLGHDPKVEAICALVCPDEKKGDVSLVGGSATGGTVLTPGAGNYQGRTISCGTLMDMTDGTVVFKTDTDGFDDSILADLMNAVAEGHRKPAIISFEGPTNQQMHDQNYDGYIAVIRDMCDRGYRILMLSNIGQPLAYVGTDADQAAWHMRSLTDAMRFGMQYSYYFDFIAVAPELTCETFKFEDRAMRDRVWTNIYKKG